MDSESGGGGRLSRLLVTGILLGIGAIDSLWADESAYGFGYSAEHSDNINLAPSNERSDWIHSLLAGYAYQKNTTDLVARVLAQVTYNTYQKESFGDETLVDLIASAVWTMSPQRFIWTLEDTNLQALVDSTGVNTPVNRTNVNVLSTGPDVYLQLAPVHTLALGARAEHVYTGQVDADNMRFRGSVAWAYQPSPITTLSLNYQVVDVNYDNSSLNNDYTSQDTFFRVLYDYSRSQYQLDLGTTHAKFDNGTDVQGPLARLSWNRQSTPESSFGVSVSQEISDTVTDVLAASPTMATRATPGGASEQASIIVTGDVYVTRGGTIFYNHHGSQFSAQFEAGERTLNFEATPQDRKETNGSLQMDYLFPGATRVALFTEYTETEYLDVTRSDNEWNSGIRADYQLRRTVSLGLEGRRDDRRSTVASSSYIDNRVLFTILYSTGPLSTPLRRR